MKPSSNNENVAPLSFNSIADETAAGYCQSKGKWSSFGLFDTNVAKGKQEKIKEGKNCMSPKGIQKKPLTNVKKEENFTSHL